jgi:hypothetical protein
MSGVMWCIQGGIGAESGAVRAVICTGSRQEDAAVSPGRTRRAYAVVWERRAVKSRVMSSKTTAPTKATMRLPTLKPVKPPVKA